MSEQDRQATRTGTQIERGLDLGRIWNPGTQALAQQFGGVRARDQYPLVDIEPVLTQPRFVRQVCGRDAFVYAPGSDLQQLLAFDVREPRIEERLEMIQRQMQRVQDQVRGLVVRVGRAVPEKKASLGKTRDRVTQPVTNGFEFLGDAHRVAGASSSRSSMPRYSPASGSRSAMAMRSFSLWMVALTGPSSTTSGQISQMKRPSEVPPLHEISGVTPQTSRTTSEVAAISFARGVR